MLQLDHFTYTFYIYGQVHTTAQYAIYSFPPEAEGSVHEDSSWGLSSSHGDTY
jgi:hypothetical protein